MAMLNCDIRGALKEFWAYSGPYACGSYVSQKRYVDLVGLAVKENPPWRKVRRDGRQDPRAGLRKPPFVGQLGTGLQRGTSGEEREYTSLCAP